MSVVNPKNNLLYLNAFKNGQAVTGQNFCFQINKYVTIHSCKTYIKGASFEKLTVSTVEVVHLLEAGGTGTGERLVAGKTQVAAASVVGATAVPATYRRHRESQLSM